MHVAQVAVRLARGTLVCLDPACVPFSRIWCLFEWWTTLRVRDRARRLWAGCGVRVKREETVAGRGVGGRGAGTRGRGAGCELLG